MSAGDDHSLVLLEGGAVLSFGYGGRGQLGHGGQEIQLTPKPIAALRGKKVLQVSAGQGHSLVLLEGGTAMSFGDGHVGGLHRSALGHQQWTPRLVESNRPSVCAVEVAAGCAHSALLGRFDGVSTSLSYV